ncbi:Cytochrome P450 oxidoreductase [Lasiodiplodia theobromae]|uniref:Cytochrome P450 monooxygenase yanH n=1 Tax=Lasiodiplodia theobromae TaxID=45133 RepID=A0A5N5D5U9_9PEZI|nr:Cytochrome P450 oxidoreductase [Lasiodiplodia theobromae]KAB2572680.1 Cytochrome P450 monooxygenase yanH [Lasiodiplodia theobromae]KAF4538212.1 Cytochrome P450 oxidoreductase [Lasiodiplodia theobromae]
MESLKLDPRAMSPATLALYTSALFALFKFLQAIYRLYFHPLSHFPGPRAAALSRNWLWQQVQTGHPEEILEQLHRNHYGGARALRTAPNELHITDVAAYKTIYSQTNPFPKEPSFYDCFHTPHTLFAETDPALHRERRKILNPLFSRAGVAKLEPVILEKVQEMGAKLRRLVTTNPSGSIDVSNMVRCVTVDVISEFAFGQSAGLLAERPDAFSAAFLDAFDIAAVVPYRLYYSALQRFLSAVVPLAWVGKFDPAAGEMARLLKFANDSFYSYAKRTTTAAHPVVFDYMKSVPEGLQPAEAMDVLVAGSDTTAYTLATGLFHILRMPEVKARLEREVREAVPDKEGLVPFVQLEKIDYLRACVKESLRVAMPVPGALPRVVPARSQPFEVDGKIIPPGTIVGMSAYTMHYSEELWGKDAKVFNPDRWLGPNAKHLDTYLCTFSKGARQCIGINVAHTEATMVLAYLFRNFQMELKTSEFRHRDVFTQQVLEPGVLVDFTPL